jgi:hypothetical protein
MTDMSNPSIEMLEPATEVVDAAPDTVGTALAICTRVEQGLATLEEAFKGVVYDVTRGAGMDAARKARQEIREVRYSVANAVDDAKKRLNGLKKQVDARGDAIALRLLDLEEPIHNQIKAEEDRRAAEKAAREQAEREARDALMQRLDAIRAVPLDMLNASAEAISSAIDLVTLTDSATFGEFAPAADRAIAETLKRLSDLYDAAAAREQAEADRKAIEAQLAAERAEKERILAEQRAELERQQAALRHQQEIAEAAERERQAAVEREQLAERAAQAKRDQEAREAAARAQAIADAAAAAERELQAAQLRAAAAAAQRMEAAAAVMLVALTSVQAWNADTALLPSWIADQVDQSIAAALPEESTHVQ